ncbi:unnamed protein product [Soboliphyme baturini]|uniref:RNase III domain-containing protein n=1 Tax=Soboliphyme baturini TaxID=241478 RepID=A0A183IG70_9BILA|nr:unnamed protein product [Soboliphyme baturini]
MLRSKEVCNYNLYRLGKNKNLPGMLIAHQFLPTENWLPPGYVVADISKTAALIENENGKLMDEKMDGLRQLVGRLSEEDLPMLNDLIEAENRPCATAVDVASSSLSDQFMLNRLSDKCIADCVEALLGVYLLSCGCNSTIKVMEWLGLKVSLESLQEPMTAEKLSPECANELDVLWKKYGISDFEKIIGYTFNNKVYLVESLTHSSFSANFSTRCYQRLEFLGDAVIDYLITRHFFDYQCNYTPGILTDLRSAMVNNTIFATIAVKYKYHKVSAIVTGFKHGGQIKILLSVSDAYVTSFILRNRKVYRYRKYVAREC